MSLGVPQKSKNRKHPPPTPLQLFYISGWLLSPPHLFQEQHDETKKKKETHGAARKKRTKVKKASEFTGKSSKMKGKYQKKNENTWETQKTKKIPKKNKKKSKINLAPFEIHPCQRFGREKMCSFGGRCLHVRSESRLGDTFWQKLKNLML